MDAEPSKRWQVLRLRLLWRLPGEPRKKIKRFLKLGDQFLARGEAKLAEYCYELSQGLAQEAGTVHLLKKIRQRVQ
ncbi:MAG TPA: hypothetical protein GX521_00200 [Firmicutes bacterium]|nr:hypothetical protein [Bacillota bacterium]